MLGNSYASSGGTLTQNQVQGGNSALSSVGMLHDVNSSDTSPFDINDFPQLTGRPSSAGGPQGPFGKYLFCNLYIWSVFRCRFYLTQ
jgi:CCR4-NOT transcription complex subunit 2